MCWGTRKVPADVGRTMSSFISWVWARPTLLGIYILSP